MFFPNSMHAELSFLLLHWLTWFSSGIGYFKCDYPDHFKSRYIVQVAFSISWPLVCSESVTLQSPIKTFLTYDLHCIFFTFSLLLINYFYPLSVLSGKCCQGWYLDQSDKKGFDPACTNCICHPSKFSSLLPSPSNLITRKPPVTPSRIPFLFYECALQKSDKI